MGNLKDAFLIVTPSHVRLFAELIFQIMNHDKVLNNQENRSSDGIVFYFHGKSDEHFSLVSDINLQINSRFIGLRPAGRTRDYAWIQALGLMFGSHTFTLEATKTEKWDSEEDHLQFSYDGEALSIPEGLYLEWTSPGNNLKVERISSKNSATVTLSEAVELSVNVIPVTEEDNRTHNYQLEVQFRFFSLSAQVEGVLGQT
ncbi:hypothetical protein PVL29_012803 [Vitis rotundifolia]|uniref:Uncharacterized protein n=1 Tax=Vitis rotundifolia TaxID=103349 RepID=A0AA38ZK55_VITRO|nr:hypothetical protein PVL29_012803 [Vitis rotundifolia]